MVEAPGIEPAFPDAIGQSVGVSRALAPPAVDAEHESPTRNLADARALVRHPGRLGSSEGAAWARVEALATAAQALAAAGLAVQARPLLEELVSVARAARGAGAAVVNLPLRGKAR